MDDTDFLIPVSVFENKDDNRPSRHEMAWHAFAQRLCRYDERPTKDGKAWSPVTYVPGTTRGKHNVDMVYALVLDIDYGNLPTDLLEGREMVAHTTFQHTPEAPRWRVVLPLLAPIKGADWPEFWLRANVFFGGCVDPATKDSSRIFYLPSCPPGGTHEVKQQHGALLDAGELPEVPVYTPSPRKAGRKRSVFKQGLAEWAQRFSIVKTAELASMPRDSGRNDACNRLAHLLGGLVAEPLHDLQPEWVVDQLLEACHQNGLINEDGERSVHATIRSGLESGLMRAWSPADQDPVPSVQHANGRVQSPSVQARTRETRLRVRPMFDVEPEPVSWLWRGRLARGKPTLLMGDPGLGKSLLSHWLSAQVSIGAVWPDGNGSAELGGAILFTIEDGLADTVKPRLMAANADTKRIFAVQGVTDDLDENTTTLDDRLFTLEEHIQLLEAVTEKQASLVVFDPITAYLGANINSHRESDVRRVLGPLGLMAERTGVALLLLMHLNKGTGVAALYRAAGSIAFPAVARIVLGVAPDPNDETPEPNKRKLLLPVKLSVGQAREGLGYHIERTQQQILKRVSDEDQPPVLVWDDEPVLIDATSAMDRSGAVQEMGALAECKAALVQVMATNNWRVLAREGERQLKDAGVSTSPNVLVRARHELGIKAVKESFSGPWYWEGVPKDQAALARTRARQQSRDLGNLGDSSKATEESARESQEYPKSHEEFEESSRAREAQEFRYCVHCMKNLPVDVYEAHEPCPEKVLKT